ncbi:helix-turn-helix transcriptional regulator [Microbulbifer magnicolonia]|uniref:helix-turn-helix domain-containing protein n=1 Tax=Microbulbifer magnicolonia TaxID=3109744 RepID=UPI002B417024|nr:helix-turn-helix transcriptional regulator [Microbulbifer sp. GG15]
MTDLVSGAQMRAARGILKWSIADLEKQSGVSSMTIKRMERGDGVPSARDENIQAVYNAFISSGRIRFEGEDVVQIVFEE